MYILATKTVNSHSEGEEAECAGSPSTKRYTVYYDVCNYCPTSLCDYLQMIVNI